MVVGPLAVAVQLHHTDAPPKLPATRNGSPFWPKFLLAPTLLPVTVAIGPLIGMALKKLSLGGAWARTAIAGTVSKSATRRITTRLFIGLHHLPPSIRTVKRRTGVTGSICG